MALFGNSKAGSTSGHTHLVEIKAGKMFQRENWVYPEKQKGFLYVFQNDEGLAHFCWRDRSTNEVVDDLIIFPGECNYSRVRECTTGRVYVLKFNKSPLRLFYWLQEPKTEKDDQHCRRINQVLNSPSTLSQATFPLLNGFSQSQLNRIFGPNIAATLSSLINQEGAKTNAERSENGSHNDEDLTQIPVTRDIAPNSSDSQKEVASALKKEPLENSENMKPKMKSVTILDNVIQVKEIVEDEDNTNEEDEDDNEKRESSRKKQNMHK